MPVYGKHGNSPKPRTTPAKTPENAKPIRRGWRRGKRRIREATFWGSVRTPIEEVEMECGNIRQRTAKIIKSGGIPVVIDWGCGEGTTIEAVAKSCPKARCYGYSMEFYDTWKKSEKVKYIHAPSGELKRYLKDESVDVIYSHMGLRHLYAKKQLEEINALIPKLKIGGKLMIDELNEGTVDKLYDREDLRFEYGERGYKVEITRVK